MRSNNLISNITVNRLPLYYRMLDRLRMECVDGVSAESFGQLVGFKAGQIRKDLATFGDFGRQGFGYVVRELQANIGNILGFHRGWNIAIIGMGHLGGALASYRNFADLGFRLAAVFDADPGKIGQSPGNLLINSMDDLERVVQERDIHIGVITVPGHNAQAVADRLLAAGVKGIWNFAPAVLNVPSDVKLVNEDLSVGLCKIDYLKSLANDCIYSISRVFSLYPFNTSRRTSSV